MHFKPYENHIILHVITPMDFRGAMKNQLHRFQYRSAASIDMIRNVRLENTAIT